MTTLHTDPKIVHRVHAMEMPSYAYHYPHIKRVQLAAVKEAPFHPNLPTLRRMDMDTAGSMLSDQHSRTSTTSAPLDFKRRRTAADILDPPSIPLSSLNMTDTGRAIHKLYTTPDELKKSRADWSDFLRRCPERFDIRLPEIPDKKDLHFDGYAIRYLRPDVTRSWNYTLKQEPNLNQAKQMPIPANTHSRYRDSFPKYFRHIAGKPWYAPN